MSKYNTKKWKVESGKWKDNREKLTIHHLSLATNNSGMALIIIVAVIAILSAIGVTFMYEMRLEEKAAFNYMNSLKASYIAKSGIEHAIAVLKEDGGDTGYDSYENDKWGYKYQVLADSTFSAYQQIDSVDNDSCLATFSPGLLDGRDSRWIYVYDEEGLNVVGRYAVLILDESSKININTAGNIVANQGWKLFEISLKKFFEALGYAGAQSLADDMINYRYCLDGMPGTVDVDDNADSIILEYDGIDNDADGTVDEPGEGIDDPYEFVLWEQYGDDSPFITDKESAVISPEIEPYITVYSSDENTNDSGFIRMNINLVKDAMALYTVMYDAWDDLIPQPGYSYDYIRQLSAQAAVNTIDYADTDNVSTFLEISDGTDTTIARGVEAIRINEIMVKPAYQWEAENLFDGHLGTNWSPDSDDTHILCSTPSAETNTNDKPIIHFEREGHYRVRALSYDDYDAAPPITDNRFSICIYDDKGDTVIEDTAGEHNMGGWLLENLGVVEVKKDHYDYTIVLKTSAGLDDEARLDYIQFSQQPDCEYVELVNISDRDVDISGWTLTTSAGFAGTIPKDTIIEAGDYMVLTVDRDDDFAFMKDPDVEQGANFGAGSDDIAFKNTWPDVVLDKHVRALELSTSPVDIANLYAGDETDTIILPGSIFEDSPLLTPEQLDYSGIVGSATNNTLTPSVNPNWKPNEWKGSTVTANGQARRIIGNTPSEVTISSNWDSDPSGFPYHIHFTPAAVTLWKGLLDKQEIVAEIDYSAEQVDTDCYTYSQGNNQIHVKGFVALEKNDPTAISDDDRDGVDDWWLLNNADIKKRNIPGGTPGEKNSVATKDPADPDHKKTIKVRNLPFATIGDIKEVSTSDTVNEWSKVGYLGSSGAEDIELIKRLADKITVSEKRLDEESSEDYYTIGVGGPWTEYPSGDTFLTPYSSTSDQDDTGVWVWGVDQRINPDTAFYTLYISGKVLRTIDNPDTMLVKVTTGVAPYDTKELSFSPDNIAEYGQITIGGGIPGEGGDTALLMLEIWKNYSNNTISFDAAILAPEYRTYGRININTADTPVLQALPEIGPILAENIVSYREDIDGADNNWGVAGEDDDNDGTVDNPEEYNWPGSDDGPFNDIGEILNVDDPAMTLDLFSKISNLITTKSKVFTIISEGQALRRSDKGDVTIGTDTYEILGEKKYIVVMER